jgi:hypothetical protein
MTDSTQGGTEMTQLGMPRMRLSSQTRDALALVAMTLVVAGLWVAWFVFLALAWTVPRIG